MVIEIRDGSEVPIYLQLRNQIVSGISAGALEPGEQLLASRFAAPRSRFVCSFRARRRTPPSVVPGDPCTPVPSLSPPCSPPAPCSSARPTCRRWRSAAASPACTGGRGVRTTPSGSQPPGTRAPPSAAPSPWQPGSAPSGSARGLCGRPLDPFAVHTPMLLG